MKVEPWRLTKPTGILSELIKRNWSYYYKMIGGERVYLTDLECILVETNKINENKQFSTGDKEIDLMNETLTFNSGKEYKLIRSETNVRTRSKGSMKYIDTGDLQTLEVATKRINYGNLFVSEFGMPSPRTILEGLLKYFSENMIPENLPEDKKEVMKSAI